MLNDEPHFISAILRSDWFWLLTRVVVAFMFWWTGLQWLVKFDQATGAAASVHLSPPTVFGGVLIAFYLLGSVAIILDRGLWLGAGAFGVFVTLTIFMVHTFWRQPPEQAAQTWLEVKEHITVIGGLMVVAVASHFRKLAKPRG